ncbi:hypothetical protein IZ6_31420 [Terrihabitans soli]|uniref:TadE-like domain-containing protein n=2 Tax=Terrihabitans soli TaxID=708113 RepID=A0A6S6QWV8_9HYPH|nr:hypothetical protein IZ6_31420 [Terrihabitans soli]
MTEFAIVIPVLLLIIAGTVDFGRAIYSKFRLESAVSASANYAMVNSAQVAAGTGPALAGNLATILLSNTSTAVTGKVTVNNGPVSQLSGGTVSNSGTASRADSCYCPTASSGAINWGSAVTCGAACPAGGLAGKFVEITAEYPHKPMFLARDPRLTARAVVQTQ